MKNPFSFILVRWWHRAALNNLIMQKYQKAEEYFKKIQAVEPYRFGLGHNLALVALARERYEEAEKYFLNELERYGDTFVRFKSLGDLYYIWGKREQCAEYYKKALALCEHEGDKRQITHRIAQCENEPVFEKAMRSYSLLKAGNKKMAEKDFDGGYDLLKESVALDPCNFQAWNNLGALEMNIKKNAAESVKFFEKAAMYTSLVGIHGNLKKARDMLAKELKK
ncbi:MAG: tetratricopeptide repeat protein [Spirochaetales bacterium]|jgi:tetratricopeptide (TPR) repeat protein|nr:tetratricopeptide repeat protein [Spirochaetales bacterium]